MNKDNFINAVRELGLSEEDYIVIGSGILCALNIRQADDIDIVVSERTFYGLLLSEDWNRNNFDDGTFVLVKGAYEIGVDRKLQNAKPTLEELKEDQSIIDGVPFISLKRVMSLKLERGSAKDLKDIQLIKRYLNSGVYIGKGKLAGKGLYAARDYKKGELVKSWNLKPLTQEQFDALPKSEHMFVHTFGGKLFLFPEPSRYTNHSAQPTVYSDFHKQCDYALRSIKKGEQITINGKREVEYELLSFVTAHEQKKISDFKWLEGGYRNAVVSYHTQGGSTKTLSLKRLNGNWHILNKQ